MSPRRPSGRPQRTEPPAAIDQIAAEPVEPPAPPQPTEPLPPLDTAPPPLAVSTNDGNSDSPIVPGSASTPAESPIISPVSPEEHRPGLGPMIKAKRSQNKLAGALWKAAAASNAFKPRAGGAGEKLLKAAKEEQDKGPDGITAVVPAPPRPKSIEKKPEPVPEVTVSQAEPAPPETAKVQKPEPKPEPKQIPEPEVKDERKKSVLIGNDLKYLTTLGVDPSILDNKTAQFTEWLDFFSWVPGDKMRTLNSDEMKFDIERELNKAQAGGWLARFQEEDERVDAIKTGIDAAVDECDELDNLLTLYTVELSVSLSCSVLPCNATNFCPRPSKMTLHISRHKAKVCRSRQRIKSYSRRSSSRFWKLVRSLQMTCRPYQWRLSKLLTVLKKSKRHSSPCTRP